MKISQVAITVFCWKVS